MPTDLNELLQQIAEQDNKRQRIMPSSEGGLEKCKCSHKKRYHKEINGKLICKYNPPCKCIGFVLASKKEDN